MATKTLPAEVNLSALLQEIPCKWRVQSANEKLAILIPYIDARDCQRILDEACGPHRWQSRHKNIGSKVYCEVGILFDGEWIWKSDVGSESNVEKEKGEASDSFKRACVQWGIGRFLYEKNPLKVKTTKIGSKFIPFSQLKKKPIYGGPALNMFVNYCLKTEGLYDAKTGWIHG